MARGAVVASRGGARVEKLAETAVVATNAATVCAVGGYLRGAAVLARDVTSVTL